MGPLGHLARPHLFPHPLQRQERQLLPEVLRHPLHTALWRRNGRRCVYAVYVVVPSYLECVVVSFLLGFPRFL